MSPKLNVNEAGRKNHNGKEHLPQQKLNVKIL